MTNELEPYQEHQDEEDMNRTGRVIGETDPKKTIELNEDGSVKRVTRYTIRLVVKGSIKINLKDPEQD